MKRNKLKLERIVVESFTTKLEIQEQDTIRGGSGTVETVLQCQPIMDSEDPCEHN